MNFILGTSASLSYGCSCSQILHAGIGFFLILCVENKMVLSDWCKVAQEA